MAVRQGQWAWISQAGLSLLCVLGKKISPREQGKGILWNSGEACSRLSVSLWLHKNTFAQVFWDAEINLQGKWWTKITRTHRWKCLKYEDRKSIYMSIYIYLSINQSSNNDTFIATSELHLKSVYLMPAPWLLRITLTSINQLLQLPLAWTTLWRQAGWLSACETLHPGVCSFIFIIFMAFLSWKIICEDMLAKATTREEKQK